MITHKAYPAILTLVCAVNFSADTSPQRETWKCYILFHVRVHAEFWSSCSSDSQSSVMLWDLHIIPEHARPSPMYPALQVQLKDPNVFVQFAFTWQLFMPLSHSLISISYKELKEKNTNKILNLTNENSSNKYVLEFLQLWIKQFSLRSVPTLFMQSSNFVLKKKHFDY